MKDIELVVKIPEEIYKASQIIDVKYEDVIQIPLEVIANGLLLPKGHGRLIDADALIKTYDGFVGYDEEIQDIKDAPTIIDADKAESEEE